MVPVKAVEGEAVVDEQMLVGEVEHVSEAVNCCPNFLTGLRSSVPLLGK
jgi:hypothetical protein